MAHSASIDFVDLACQQKRDARCIGGLYSGEMDIPTWVRSARKHKSLTQEQLATRLKLTKANISAWETGRHEPGFNQLKLIEAITGFPLMSHDKGPGDRGPAQIDELFPSISPETWSELSDRERHMVELKVHEAIQYVRSLRRDDLLGKVRDLPSMAQAAAGK